MKLSASIGLMIANARRLLRVIGRAAPGAAAWLVVAAIIEAAATTVLPYTTKQIIDAVPLAHGDLTVPLLWTLVEAGVFTAMTVARNLARYHTRRIEVRAGPYLVEQLMEKASRVPYAEIESSSFLDRLSRARQDASHYGINYATQMITVGRSLLIVIGCLALLLWIAPLWTVPVTLAAVALPFAFEVSRARRSFELERTNLHRNRQGWYLEWLTTATEPAKEIRAGGVARWLVALHAKIHAPFLDGHVALARRHYAQGHLAALVMAVMMYGPYVVFLAATVRGERSIGELLLFALAFRQATVALGQLFTAFASAFEHHLYVHNLLAVLDHVEDGTGDPTPRAEHVPEVPPELVIKDLWFSYPSTERPVMRGLDLRVRAGETLAIVGRNGIGKTTLVKLLLGLYRADRGSISLGGEDLATKDPAWRRDNIGVVFQDFVRYQFSASWNVGLGWSPDVEDGAAIDRAIEMADAGPIVKELAQGMSTPLGAAFGGQDLSGGQWQRIALARLFMRRSRLWILDEPTSAMDPETEERTVRTFRKWTEGRTAIVITHRFATVRLADRIAVVDEGRVVELGTHEELLAAGNDYARIYRMQAEAFGAAG